MVTLLSLAIGVRDRDFIEWLLENGAGAEAQRQSHSCALNFTHVAST